MGEKGREKKGKGKVRGKKKSKEEEGKGEERRGRTEGRMGRDGIVEREEGEWKRKVKEVKYGRLGKDQVNGNFIHIYMMYLYDNHQ